MSSPSVPDAAVRETARWVYGQDASGYDAGRPDYPRRAYEIMTERGRLVRGTRTLEIGPGTGRVTRHLVEAGATVIGVEPDPALARVLRANEPTVTVLASTFEEAELPAAGFDLVVAATSFHWVDLEIGLAKLGRVLRPGGSLVLVWERFEDPERPHPLSTALASVSRPEGRRSDDRPPFEIDVEAWEEALTTRAGLSDYQAEIIGGDIPMDASRVRALYASWTSVRRLPADERARFLDGIEAMVRSSPEGRVDHPFIVAVHSATKPPRDASR